MTDNGHNGAAPVPATLDDLGEIRTDVTITRPDGKTMTVPMRSLGEQEVFEMRAAMKWPEPPFEIGRWDGPDRPPRKKFNYDDAKYAAEMAAANRRFSRRLLARALLVDIPGDTDDAKAAALESKLGAWASGQLTSHLNRMLGIGEAEVAAVADSFQPT